MNALLNRLPFISSIVLGVFFAIAARHGLSGTTLMLIVSSVLMFAACWTSAVQLVGGRSALVFVVIAFVVGWFAEQTGSSYGWFFGEYVYTDVLGPRLVDVPLIIPLMWFALCWVAYVIGNFIILHAPVDPNHGLGNSVIMSLLAGMIVTAYDLGADPYMVFVLKAWIMTKTDGWWFGETLQGFAGWTFITFVIVGAFRLSLRVWPACPASRTGGWQALLPLVIYGASMLFQIIYGSPVETRTIALFAMGIPLLCAGLGWSRWRRAAAADTAAAAAAAADTAPAPAPAVALAAERASA